eukprot:12909308-Prorocentrum_lima.AAC.1
MGPPPGPLSRPPSEGELHERRPQSVASSASRVHVMDRIRARLHARHLNVISSHGAQREDRREWSA